MSNYVADQRRRFITFHLLVKWFSLTAIPIVLSILVCIALTLLLSPSLSQYRSHCIPGWNRHLKEPRGNADFNYMVWMEAGSPS